MKISILTLQFGYNYGGALQCLALQNTLIEMGHEVNVLNYYPVFPKQTPFWKGWGLSGPKKLENISKRILQLRYLKSYQSHFDSFKADFLNLTEICHTKEGVSRVARGSEALIVGSDQVWNLHYHPDPVYYLAYPENFKGKKISYAACCGQDTGKADEWVGKQLQEFNGISVRDAFTVNWIEAQVKRLTVEIVADPTLLYDFPDLPEIENKLERYIFVYILGDGRDEFHIAAIAELKKKYGDIPVILAMPTGYKIKMYDWVNKTLWMLDPLEWVAWLANASVVYTDSFHGVLFSLKYKCEFLAYYIEEIRSPRLKFLAEQFSINEKIIEADVKLLPQAVSAPVSWGKIDSVILCLRKTSKIFLNRQLSE